jgi:hypothetical protein
VDVKHAGDAASVPIGEESLLPLGERDAGKNSNGGRKGRRYWQNT